MPHLIYHVAASEDGYIAGPDHDLSWLRDWERGEDDDRQAAFVASVDGLVMGRLTYEVVQARCAARAHDPRGSERGRAEWPYGARPTWVCRHDGDTPPSAPAGVRYTREGPAALRRRWRALGLRRVWLVGGGRLAQAFVEQDAIDELLIVRVPVRLGAGVPLFGADAAGTRPPAGWTQAERAALPHGLVQERWQPPRA